MGCRCSARWSWTNIAYIAAKGGALVALDATAGKELWVHSFVTGGGGRAGIGGQRGANYWESKDRKDRRIFVTSGGYLYAIDALTGKNIDSFAEHGKLDLKIGIDRAPIPLASRTPGRIFENLIILGSFQAKVIWPRPEICARSMCGRASWSGCSTRFRALAAARASSFSLVKGGASS